MRVFIFVFFAFLTIGAIAQKLTWADYYQSSDVKNIVSDEIGNSYIFNNGLLTKRDINGNILKVDTFNVIGFENIAIDDNGDLYLSGRVNSGDYFYNNQLVFNSTGDGIGIIKIDDLGNFLWHQTFSKNFDVFLGSPNYIWYNDYDLEIGTQGVYIAFQSFGSNIKVGNNIILNGSGGTGYGVFLKLYKNNGQLGWFNSLKSNNDEASFVSIIQSSSGDVYCVGAFYGSCFLNSQIVSSDAFNPDAILVKVDSTGAIQWYKTFKMSGSHYSYNSFELAAFSNNDVAMSGFFEVYAVLDGTNAVFANGISDGYLMRIDSQSNVKWIELVSGPNDDYVFDIDINKNDRVYVSALSSDSVLINNRWINLDYDAVIDGGQGLLLKYNENGSNMYVKKLNKQGWDAKIDSRYDIGTFWSSWNDNFVNQIIDSVQIDSSGVSNNMLIGLVSENNCENDSILINAGDNITICQGENFVLSTLNNYQTYIWNTGEVSENIIINTPGIYSVVAHDSLGCSYTSENINVEVIQNNLIPQICLVTVDTTSSKNLVVWEKPISNDLDSFKIYREAGVNYYPIGTVHYDSLSQFTDNTAGINPNITSYRYKISSIDKCGNESELSDFHETIHLTTNLGSGQEINLIWDTYEGFSFPYYYIWRDFNSNNNWSVIDSVNFINFTYTDLNPPTGNVSYRIEVIPPYTCTSTLKAVNHNSTRSNRSNQTTSGITGIKDIIGENINIYPNPNSGSFNISGDILGSKIEVFNGLGQMVYNNSKLLENTLRIEGLSKGVYFLKVQNINFIKTYKVVVE